ncbi:hypothetical protein AAVH_28841 [Aphelenchoides avenae]|nr:hypothetical protein AAVH_28841 [Aphelenchus avenae]
MSPASVFLILAGTFLPSALGVSLRYSSNGYTLTFYDQTPGSNFNRTTQDRMVSAFFTVYPTMRNTYNPSARTEVNFYMDPSYEGVAAMWNGEVHFDPDYMNSNPKDIDVVTHECMHIVQGYNFGGTPGWATEGIADYVRYKLGVDNAGAGWSLGEFQPGQQYTDAYRVTARFLVWMELRYKSTFVKEYDAALRAGTFSDFWTRTTGKSVDALWTEYTKDPSLAPAPAPAPPPSSATFDVYDATWHTGNSATIALTSTCSNELASKFNDRASSVHSHGACVRLFEHSDCQGSSIMLKPDCDAAQGCWPIHGDLTGSGLDNGASSSIRC